MQPRPKATKPRTGLLIAAIAGVILLSAGLGAWLAIGGSGNHKGKGKASAPSTSPAAPSTATPSASPTNAASCMPKPSACGYPDATTTGVPAGTKLTEHPGSQTITKDGTVIDGWESGGIIVKADNVTIRNSRITTADFWGIHGVGEKGLRVEDVTIVGRRGCDVGIDAGSAIIQRVNVSGCVDAIHAHGQNRILDSFLRTAADGHSHDDGIQVVSASGLVIRHNTIDIAGDPAGNAAIFAQQSSGPIDGITIADNLLNGGGYTAYIEQSANVVLSDNRFGPAHKFGWYSAAHNTNTPTLTGSIDDITGKPLTR